MTDKKVDVAAKHSDTAEKVRKTREQRDPMNNPELRQIMKPARAKRDDIYGPRDQ